MGSPDKLLFSSMTDAIISKHYRLLGQLSALAILNIGRGRQCFHPAAVNYIFDDSKIGLIQDVENAELSAKVAAISNGDSNILLEADIVPTISRTAAMEQFKHGIKSVCKELIDTPCYMKNYFLKDNGKKSNN